MLLRKTLVTLFISAAFAVSADEKKPSYEPTERMKLITLGLINYASIEIGLKRDNICKDLKLSTDKVIEDSFQALSALDGKRLTDQELQTIKARVNKAITAILESGQTEAELSYAKLKTFNPALDNGLCILAKSTSDLLIWSIMNTINPQGRKPHQG